MSDVGADSERRAAFERLLGEMRPRLHRYCARMTGSVVDGEDVVQDALIKAMEAFPRIESLAQAEGWLFKIAHNAALDFLRRRGRRDKVHADEDMEMIADPVIETEQRQAASASLRTFMRLPVAQRSSVILMDVLGYSIQEVGGIIDASVPAVKAALHRGRGRLRELAREPEDAPPPALSEDERRRLAAYVERFNARDFDTIRSMLADDVRLDLVARSRLQGRSEVGRYFTNYAKVGDWRFALGLVDGHPAALVGDVDQPQAPPRYFVLLGWSGDRLVSIRDFRYARYATEGADIRVLT